LKQQGAPRPPSGRRHTCRGHATSSASPAPTAHRRLERRQGPRAPRAPRLQKRTSPSRATRCRAASSRKPRPRGARSGRGQHGSPQRPASARSSAACAARRVRLSAALVCRAGCPASPAALGPSVTRRSLRRAAPSGGAVSGGRGEQQRAKRWSSAGLPTGRRRRRPGRRSGGGARARLQELLAAHRLRQRLQLRRRGLACLQQPARRPPRSPPAPGTCTGRGTVAGRVPGAAAVHALLHCAVHGARALVAEGRWRGPRLRGQPATAGRPAAAHRRPAWRGALCGQLAGAVRRVSIRCGCTRLPRLSRRCGCGRRRCRRAPPLLWRVHIESANGARPTAERLCCTAWAPASALPAS